MEMGKTGRGKGGRCLWKKAEAVDPFGTRNAAETISGRLPASIKVGNPSQNIPENMKFSLMQEAEGLLPLLLCPLHTCREGGGGVTGE